MAEVNEVCQFYPWDAQRVTCPQGKPSVGWTPAPAGRHDRRIRVRFGRADCAACSTRLQCTTSKEARRVLYLQPREQYEAAKAVAGQRAGPSETPVDGHSATESAA